MEHIIKTVVDIIAYTAEMRGVGLELMGLGSRCLRYYVNDKESAERLALQIFNYHSPGLVASRIVEAACMTGSKICGREDIEEMEVAGREARIAIARIVERLDLEGRK